MISSRYFIIVDDDPINNTICSMTLKHMFPGIEVKTFLLPEEALDFISANYVTGHTPTVLFLDINMPTLTGWEFMEQYNQYDGKIRSQISIYILSSSVDERDKDRADNIKEIKGIISKPLTSETIELLNI